MAKAKARKPGFMEHYDKPGRRYEPEAVGYGTPAQWRGAFAERMSLEEAEVVIGTGSPWAVLGVRQGASAEEIRAAYKRMAIKYHPSSARNAGKDQVLLGKQFKQVLAAYTMLTGGK